MDFSKLGKKFQAVASSTAKKAGEQVQIAKLQIDKTTLNKDITDAFTALGKYCYLNLESEDLVAGIRGYKRDIEELKLKVAEIEREIEKVKAEGAEDEDVSVEFEEKPLTFEDDIAEEPQTENTQPALEKPEEE